MSLIRFNRGLQQSVASNLGRIGAPFNKVSTLFDGIDDFAQTSGDVPALNGLNKMTWVWLFKWTAVTINKTMFSKWDFQTQGGWTFGSDNVNNDELELFIADSLADAGVNKITTLDANLSSGVWSKIAVVYDGTLTNPFRLKCYINSVIKGVTVNGTLPISLTNGNASVKVGRIGGAASRNFPGNMDEIGIFKGVAFDQSEIDEVHPITGVIDLQGHSQAANLNNYWRMGDGDTFNTIVDKIGNNNLTMVNMAANDFVNDVI